MIFAARAPNYCRLCFGQIFAHYFLWVIATTGLFGEETAQYECRIFLPNTFWGIRRWKRKWNWMKLKYVSLGGSILSLVSLGTSPVTSNILMSSLLNNTKNCSNCNIPSFMWMLCMFNMAVFAKILFIPWKIKYFWLTRGVDYSPATFCSWSTSGLSDFFLFVCILLMFVFLIFHLSSFFLYLSFGELHTCHIV